MADSKDNWQTIGEVKLNLQRAGVVATVMPIPPPMVLEIGYAITIWNDFENFFNDYLSKLIAANGADASDLERLRGRKLRKRFVDEVKARFPDAPNIIRYANQLREDANKFGKMRNALAHGRLEWEATVRGKDVQHLILAHGTEGAYRFDLVALDNLKNDLAGLAGRMNLMVSPVDAGAWLPSPDRQRLLSFAGDNHRNRAILAKLQRPQPPSPE